MRQAKKVSKKLSHTFFVSYVFDQRTTDGYIYNSYNTIRQNIKPKIFLKTESKETLGRFSEILSLDKENQKAKRADFSETELDF